LPDQSVDQVIGLSSGRFRAFGPLSRGRSRRELRRLNRYLYADSDPVGGSDPTGR